MLEARAAMPHDAVAGSSAHQVRMVVAALTELSRAGGCPHIARSPASACDTATRPVHSAPLTAEWECDRAKPSEPPCPEPPPRGDKGSDVACPRSGPARGC